MKAARIILQPARRPIVRLFAVLGIATSLPIILLGTFSDLDFSNGPHDARYLVCVLQLKGFNEALQRFHADYGRFPSATEGLDILATHQATPGWKGPYLPEIPRDPWGKPYIYRQSTDQPEILSYGPTDDPGSRLLSSLNLAEALRSRHEVGTRRTFVGLWISSWLLLIGSVLGLYSLSGERKDRVACRPSDESL